MQLQARRVFRLSGTTALSLAIGYALQLPLAFIAPIFALLLTLQPGPPLGPKKLVGLLLVVALTLGVGLLLTPLIVHYPLTGILLVALGLYAGFYLTVNRSKALVGLFLTVGFTMISAAGTVSSALSVMVIQALAVGIVIAIVSQWLVYPWFPEDAVAPKPEADPPAETSSWVALRGALIMLPAYLLLLSNPAMYMPVIMKSVSLVQQASLVSVRAAGRELLGSTLLGGVFAVALWALLGLAVNLWMYFLWVLLFTTFFAGKIYRLIASRLPPSFWLNVATTMLILLGSAVNDSSNGKDVYSAFAIRMGLFVLVALYAWLAVYLLEQLRSRRLARNPVKETAPC